VSCVSPEITSEPEALRLPDHPFEAVHSVTFAPDQVSVVLPSAGTTVGLADSVSVGAGAVTVTVRDCDADPPAPEHDRVNVLV
jgi:hypothetical protein